jgi:hypothetical protein
MSLTSTSWWEPAGIVGCGKGILMSQSQHAEWRKRTNKPTCATCGAIHPLQESETPQQAYDRAIKIVRPNG